MTYELYELHTMIVHGPMLAQTIAQADMGMWAPIITFLEALLISCGTLGIVAGAAIIAVGAHDDGKRVLGWQMIGGAAMGLAIGLLASPIYSVIDGWM